MGFYRESCLSAEEMENIHPIELDAMNDFANTYEEAESNEDTEEESETDTSEEMDERESDDYHRRKGHTYR